MKIFEPVTIAIFGLLFVLGSLGWLAPPQQDAGVQGYVWQAQAVSATPTTKTVACSQGSGHIGRKTVVVYNASPGSLVTITAELRDSQTAGNFTSGYLGVNGLATGSYGSDTAVATDAAGAFCQFSATAAVTGVITVTLRRE